MGRLLALAEATKETCSPQRLDLYMQTLCDLDFTKVARVLESMLSTARWFPKIPDIREAILGSPVKEAEEAWEEISRLIPRWRSELEFEWDAQASGFSCGSASFDLPDDPVLNRALMRLGGARAMACMNPANLNLLKRDFIMEFSSIKKEHPEMLELPLRDDLIKRLAEVAQAKRMP